MRVYLSLLISVLLLSFSFANPLSNPSVTISKNNDVVDYTILNGGANTHVFTLYGDGTCGNLSSPTHRFASSATGYTSEIYLVKPYQTTPPTKLVVNTGTITPGTSLFANPTMNVSGEVDIKTSWSAAYDSENFFIVAFQNLTEGTPTSGCVELHYHSSELTVNFPQIKEYNGWVYNRDTFTLSGSGYDRKITWEYSNLGMGETRFIYIPAKVKVSAGNQVSLSANYIVDCRDDRVVTDNGSFLSRQSPHDPNFKIVSQDCLKPGVGSHYLEYTIGFFNDGTGFADSVYLRDQLSEFLNASTVYMVDYEFAPTWSIENSVLKIDFLGIKLPGTNQINPKAYFYDDASTYVTFGVCTAPMFNLGDCILNEASIVFDTQPPFKTNISQICATMECTSFDACPESQSYSKGTIEESFVSSTAVPSRVFQCYPNPAKDHIQVVWDLKTKLTSEIQIELVDYSGRKIRTLFRSAQTEGRLEETFDISDLPKGIYFVTIRQGEVAEIQKIVKL